MTFSMISICPQRLHSRTARSLAVLALLGMLLPALPLQPAYAQTNGRVTLNFANADIEAVARTISSLTGRNVVLDSRAKGTISIQSERPVTPAQAVNQFAAALRLQGFALVESDGIYKVVPEADAKLQARMAPRTGAMGNQVVTQVFKLRHENANNLVPVLRPLISPNNTINASGAHTLVVTDYADNLQRIQRIIQGMDQPIGSDVEVIPLRHGVASDMAQLVQRLLDGSSTAVTAGAQGATAAAAPTSLTRTTIVPEARSNALIVRAPTQAQARQARALILKLDQPALPSTNGDAGNIWVVHLKNADALRIATTLRAAMAANQISPAGTTSTAALANTSTQPATTNQTQVTATSALQSAAAPSTGGQIQADPATNSLVITASEPEYRQLRAVIERLDTRRAQVYVESLIAEVSADKAAELGIQWQAPVRVNGHDALVGTNFGTADTGNILALSAAMANKGLPPAQGGINLAGLTSFRGAPILGVVANFLQKTGNANILSTPNLITLDNEEARIMIGQNVPFVTGQYTNNNSANGAVNPFQTIERKDVGLTLRVKPQIGENGTVRMQVYQEVSAIAEKGLNGPTTNKRSIESNVVVDDSQIIVLGGLLSDEYSNGQDKVPLLGDIPVLGHLFRNESRSRKKSNLMVFLRPIIVRDGREASNLSLDRYDMMRVSQLNTMPDQGLIQPTSAPVLPAVSGGPASAWDPVAQPGSSVPAPLLHQSLSGDAPNQGTTLGSPGSSTSDRDSISTNPFAAQ